MTWQNTLFSDVTGTRKDAGWDGGFKGTEQVVEMQVSYPVCVLPDNDHILVWHVGFRFHVGLLRTPYSWMTGVHIYILKIRRWLTWIKSCSWKMMDAGLETKSDCKSVTIPPMTVIEWKASFHYLQMFLNNCHRPAPVLDPGDWRWVVMLEHDGCAWGLEGS